MIPFSEYFQAEKSKYDFFRSIKEAAIIQGPGVCVSESTTQALRTGPGVAWGQPIVLFQILIKSRTNAPNGTLKVKSNNKLDRWRHPVPKGPLSIDE